MAFSASVSLNGSGVTAGSPVSPGITGVNGAFWHIGVVDLDEQTEAERETEGRDTDRRVVENAESCINP